MEGMDTQCLFVLLPPLPVPHNSHIIDFRPHYHGRLWTFPRRSLGQQVLP